MTQWPLGDLSIARISSQAQRVHRTPRDIVRAPLPGYYANLQLRGSSLMVQHGRSTVLRPGDLAIVDTTEPFAGFSNVASFHRAFRQAFNQTPAQVRTAAITDPPGPSLEPSP